MNPMTNACAATFAVMLMLFLSAPRVSGQQLPDGDLFDEQTFDPTVEILVATGNGVLASYNGYMLLRGRTREVAAGAAVILGAVGIAIGSRENANYPTASLAFGAAAVLAGGANMLLDRTALSRHTPSRSRLPVFAAAPVLTRDGRRPWPAFAVRFYVR